MAEGENSHRQEMEARVLDGYFSSKRTGQHWGGVVCLVAVACGTFLVSQGRDLYGLALVLSAIAVPVLAFVTGKITKSSELPEEIEPGGQEGVGTGLD